MEFSFISYQKVKKNTIITRVSSLVAIRANFVTFRLDQAALVLWDGLDLLLPVEGVEVDPPESKLFTSKLIRSN